VLGKRAIQLAGNLYAAGSLLEAGKKLGNKARELRCGQKAVPVCHDVILCMRGTI
jgi:hypothetical protein